MDAKIESIKVKTKDIVDFSKEVYMNPFAEPFIRLFAILKKKDLAEVEKVLIEINEQYGQGQFVCSSSDYGRIFGLPKI